MRLCRNFKGLYCQGEDIAQSESNIQHVEEALRSLDCLIVQDLFLNETAKFAHICFFGASFRKRWDFHERRATYLACTQSNSAGEW